MQSYAFGLAQRREVSEGFTKHRIRTKRRPRKLIFSFILQSNLPLRKELKYKSSEKIIFKLCSDVMVDMVVYANYHLKHHHLSMMTGHCPVATGWKFWWTCATRFMFLQVESTNLARHSRFLRSSSPKLGQSPINNRASGLNRISTPEQTTWVKSLGS